MSHSESSELDAPSHENSAATNWPSVVGTLGIVLGALMAADMIDDLLIRLFWAEENWAEWFGTEVAGLIMRSMPPLSLMVLSALIQISLGILLILGSVRLRRRRASGVGLCRTWAKLACVWVFVCTGWALWLLGKIDYGIESVPETVIQAGGVFGLVLTAGLLLAYPLFLLYWLSRLDVQAETATWAD